MNGYWNIVEDVILILTFQQREETVRLRHSARRPGSTYQRRVIAAPSDPTER